MENIPNNNSNKEKAEKAENSKRIIVFIIALVMLICGALYIGYYFYGQYTAKNEDKQISSIAETTSGSAKQIKNPIDFKSLQKGNNEIYAWIKIKDTKVNYPIVQSGINDDYYLRHSALNKSWLISGAIFTQSHNTKTFNDKVTVIYGHNGYSASMFTSLHKFQNKKFFDSHPYFYIYMPSCRLTYQVVSAFKYDDRHIMNSFDFQDTAVLDAFQKMIQSPDSSLKNVRKNLDTQINADSKIVVLSTCITNQKSNRYLVCGVLVKNEKTN